MSRLPALLRHLAESYVAVLVIALTIGLFVPSVGRQLSPYSTFILQSIFFLSALKLDLKSVAREMRNWRAVALANAFMLMAFPAVGYLLARLFAPQYALPVLILAAMPAGMTTPLLAELVGGSAAFALVLTVTTSLLAPVTVPLVIQWLAGAAVEVSFLTMFLSLLSVIIAPFALGQLVRAFMKKRIDATSFAFKPVSLTLLGLLIVSVIAKQAEAILGNGRLLVEGLAVLIVYFVLAHAAGFFGFPWLRRDLRLSTTVCLSYMNFTLAIYLAGRFFPQPEVLVPVVLSVIPWSVGIIPFRALTRRARYHAG
ncbi:bile acid:sodium symporter family protein [Patescibacteria group bacterium]|nr:MAG: bile acid:sodium symporter family protein [Patescibacteria group bacterium]